MLHLPGVVFYAIKNQVFCTLFTFAAMLDSLQQLTQSDHLLIKVTVKYSLWVFKG